MKKERIDKTIELMKQEKLEAVIYGVGANFQYLLEANDFYWQRACMTNIAGHFSAYTLPQAFLLLKQSGELTIFCAYRYADYFTKRYDNVVVSYLDQFEDALAPYICEQRIGVGFSCRPFFEETLHEIDKNIDIIDAEDLLWSIRVIKDDDEITQLRKLAAFTDEACMYVATHLKEGIRQIDAENMLIEYATRHGLSDLAFPPTVGFKTRNSILTEDVNTYDRYWKLVEGTGIAFDVGFMMNGYCSDWGRTLYYGKAPEKMKDAYHALQAGQVHMIESIVPNQTNNNQLYGFVKEKCEELGFGPDLRFPESEMLGHQIGIDCHEFPMVNKKYDFIMKRGMVFASEPKMWFENEMYMRVEDMILVTENGAESLSKFDRNLFEI